MNRLLRMLRGVVRRTGFEVVRARPEISPPPPRPDISAADAAILAQVRPFTMTSDERLLALIDAVRYLVRYSIEGTIVECGVWKGGSAMAATLALLAAGDVNRDVYLYDTFEGMPLPGESDRSFDGIPAREQLSRDAPGTGLWCCAGLEEVKQNLATTAYPPERLHCVRGLIEDTIPATVPDSIALLRLDTDWFDSTRHELMHLYPRLVHGGVLIIDDYGHWQGARRATDEYLAAIGDPVLLHRIDYTGRIAVKL